MRRVLVTGADTPLGAAVVDELVRRGTAEHVLAVVSKERPPQRGVNGHVTWLAVDLARSRDVQGLLFGPARLLGIDVLVHTTLTLEQEHGRGSHPLEVEATREILRFAEAHPTIERFVFVSWADVYRIEPDQPLLVTEDHPLELSPSAPRRVRERVEADVTVSTRIGQGRVDLAVLRCAEILAPGMGSQLWDYLRSRVCLRPFGFDPMLNLLSLEDAAHALVLAVSSDATGIFNVPGADTLPLSRLIEDTGRICLPVPGPLLAPLYELRATTLGMGFHYDSNYRRFHFSAVLDGRRARELLGYTPRVRSRLQVPRLTQFSGERSRPPSLPSPSGSPRVPG